MSADLWTILPNLSIGVVAISGLVYVVIRHDEKTDKMQRAFMTELEKREVTIRGIEKEFREHMAHHLASSSQALRESTSVLAASNKVIERATIRLDGMH